MTHGNKYAHQYPLRATCPQITSGVAFIGLNEQSSSSNIRITPQRIIGHKIITIINQLVQPPKPRTGWTEAPSLLMCYVLYVTQTEWCLHQHPLFYSSFIRKLCWARQSRAYLAVSCFRMSSNIFKMLKTRMLTGTSQKHPKTETRCPSSFFLSAAWNVSLMAEAQAATLDHEVIC